MAPATTETVQQVAGEVVENVTQKLKPSAEVSTEVVPQDSAVAPATEAPKEVTNGGANGSTNGHTNGHTSSDPAEEELPKIKTGHKEPLKLSGALDQYASFDVTPVIGREFPEASLADWLRAPNSDELIRDLAITSKRLLFSRIKFASVTDVCSLAARCGLLPQAGRPYG